MIKNYTTPLAIIIGAIVIGLSIYYGLTLEFRSDLKQCIKNYSASYPDQTRKQVKNLCMDLRMLK